jgi:hypothetical protein
MTNPIHDHSARIRKLAVALRRREIHRWLVEHGYFPESYVLPPCFRVAKCPPKPKLYFAIPTKGKPFRPKLAECVKVHFPKTELTDRIFGVIHPEIHNDIAYHISNNWRVIAKTICPKKSRVASYGFPIPINAKKPGRIGYVRSGWMIYEYVKEMEDDIAAVAYKYTHIVRADIKNFYPSIYTHSIAWAIHGKRFIRKPANRFALKFLGNRLDKLFQNANDGCTNGIPIGPVVSDLIAEIVASGADKLFSSRLAQAKIECEIVRFKDDYRILTKSEADARASIKLLQASLKEYNLDLSDDKTTISTLPDGLFRPWVSMYHASRPRKRRKYSWDEFRELYLSVLRIDKACPGTGVIDRFLADIVTKKGRLRVGVGLFNLQKVISMLLMLGTLRIKAFPKIIAILEAILRSRFGIIHQNLLINYLDSYLTTLCAEEDRNKYLIAWIGYFLMSNGLQKRLSCKPKLKDTVTRSIFSNRGLLFKECKEFKLFVGCRTAGKKISMLEHLDVFDPPIVP